MSGPSRVLIGVSRGLFVVAMVLSYLTPSWQYGTFALWPLGTLHILHYDYAPGALMLLPLMVAATWLLGVLLGRRWRSWRRPAWWVVGPALGFGALTVLRVWPVHIARTAFVAITSVGFFYAIGLYAHTELPIRHLSAALAAVMVVQGVLAVAQFALQGPVGLQMLGESTELPSAQGAHVLLVAGRRLLRAQGMSPHPNVLGGYMVIGLLVVGGRVLATKHRLERGLLAVAMLAGIIGLLLSFSRSALLALSLSLMIGACLARHSLSGSLPLVSRRWLWAAAGGLGLLLSAVLWLRLSGLGNPLEQASVRERLEDYGLAWTLIRARPLLGVGSGYYIAALWAAVGNQMGPDFPGFRTVHSIPLLAAAELGVGGAVLWVAMLLAPAAIGMHKGAVGRDWELLGLSAAFLAAFAATLLDVYLYLPTVWWPALMLGSTVGAWSRHVSQRPYDAY